MVIAGGEGKQRELARVNMVEVLSTHVWIWTVEAILRRGVGK
jgi:hypothetical protein